MKRKNELPSGNIRKKVYIGKDADGKPRYKSVTGATHSEVDSKVALLKSTIGKHSALPILFHDARQAYINMNEAVLSPSTIRGYRQMHTYFGELDGYAITMITNEVMQGWVNNFSKSHSPKTVKNAYGFAKKVLSEHGIEIKAKLPRKEQREIFVPSNEQVQAIIQHFQSKNDNDMVIAVCLASFCTLRRSEICGLTSDDIKGNTIHVHNTVVIDYNKELITKRTAKTAQSDRYIEAPEFVINLLPKDGKIVQISPDNITSRFERALKKLGYEPFRFHSLRAYAASFMHSIGIPDFAIMERGGWSSQDTLNRIYRGTVPEYKQKFIDETNRCISDRYSTIFHANN